MRDLIVTIVVATLCAAGLQWLETPPPRVTALLGSEAGPGVAGKA